MSMQTQDSNLDNLASGTMFSIRDPPSRGNVGLEHNGDAHAPEKGAGLI